MEKRYVIDVGPQLTYLMFRCHRKPAHCKNYVWPESRSEDVFKELDHAFQPMSKSWRLRTSLYGWDASIFPHLPVEEDDKGVDLLDLLLQELHQLLHSLTIALNIISKAWLDLDRKQLIDLIDYLDLDFALSNAWSVNNCHRFLVISIPPEPVRHQTFHAFICKPSSLSAGVPGHPLGSLSSNEALAAVEVVLSLEVVRAAEKHVAQAWLARPCRTREIYKGGNCFQYIHNHHHRHRRLIAVKLWASWWQHHSSGTVSVFFSSFKWLFNLARAFVSFYLHIFGKKYLVVRIFVTSWSGCSFLCLWQFSYL